MRRRWEFAFGFVGFNARTHAYAHTFKHAHMCVYARARAPAYQCINNDTIHMLTSNQFDVDDVDEDNNEHFESSQHMDSVQL